MKSDNPTIAWCDNIGRQCLKFTFKDTLTESNAESAISEWKQNFQTAEDKAIVLVWDCRNMKGYESGARIKWTETLKQLKSRIEEIWLISESPLIRMGASVMGLALSVKVKAVKSEADIVARN